MTTTERSEKARTIALNRNVAKVPPATLHKIQEDAKAEAIDAYEKSHKLGKYKEVMQNIGGVYVPKFPELPHINETFNKLHQQVNDGLAVTSKEEVTQNLEMANHHIGVAYRYIKKAICK